MLQVGHEPLVAEAVDRARGVVDVAAAAGIVVEVVRRAERLHEGPGQVIEGAAAIGKRDAAPAEGLDRLVEFVGDVVEGLVPGRPPPLAAATRAAMRISGVCGRCRRRTRSARPAEPFAQRLAPMALSCGLP